MIIEIIKIANIMSPAILQ